MGRISFLAMGHWKSSVLLTHGISSRFHEAAPYPESRTLTSIDREPGSFMSVTTSSPLLDRLRSVVGRDAVLASPSDLLVYECDGFTIEKNKPDVVVFPTSTEQVVQIVKLCREAQVPFLPRGAGTSLAGGCLPVGGGVMIALTCMKRILEVHTRDRYAVVEPGVVNLG